MFLTRFDIESTKLDGTGRTLDDAVEFEGDAAAAAMTVIFTSLVGAASGGSARENEEGRRHDRSL